PSLISGFQIVRKIGQGGMGIVYEAMDQALQRKVALKKMRDEISDDPREKNRFLKEARTVASLKHPHIIEIYSIQEMSNGLYLVFEYVSGQTMDEMLGERKNFVVNESFQLLKPVAQALDYAHGNGIVHRDLKPSNIMVSHTREVKVMDFGIARQVQDTLSKMSRWELVGTLSYMAPEQHRGEYCKESDIYSLGICFYEMLSGTTPFKGDQAYSLKEQRKYDALSRIFPSLSPKINLVMDKVLEPLPKNRFHSATEFLSSLEEALTPRA
ncbi:MAG: serine/threonine protein kinase, partial [Elusimicrobia bacterium]|nr:serine/threonine protein kinase [Elusimicrobiota bacterium]